MYGLQAIKDRDGIPISEQVRRALRAWIEEKRAGDKVASRRANIRRRP